MFYSYRKVQQIFRDPYSEADPAIRLDQLAEKGRLPDFALAKNGKTKKGWNPNNIGLVGAHVGFLKRPSSPRVITTFITKGGVLKTSLSLNIARMSAIHGIRTLVIGLDLQADISTALGFDSGVQDADDVESAMNKLAATQGLWDYFKDTAELDDIILATDLPHLSFIPETPELAALSQHLIHRHQRESWLKKKVIEPLHDRFDLFVLDCSPNWNLLITNALTATDVLLSPLECKITNFRNFRMFDAFINEFKADMDLEFEHLYLPTRLQPARKLSLEIFEWYLANIEGLIQPAIKDSVQGEEAVAMHLAVPEYAPSSKAGEDMKKALSNLWTFILKTQAIRGQRSTGPTRSLDAPL